MGYTSDQLDSKAERDRVNEAMRASDLWRNAIKGMGLNPDGPLKLSKTQQQQLASTLGLPTSDFHIDPAGNINDYHGWKGLPTAAKIAIAAGAAVATAGAAGAFSGGASAAAGAGGAAGASGAAAGGVGAGTTAAVTGGAAAATGGFWKNLGGFLTGNIGSQLIDTGGKLVAGKIAADASNKGLEAQSKYLNDALDWEKKVYGDDQAFFAPYGALGTDSVARLSDMMKQPRTPVTADSLMSSGRVSPISLAAMKPVGSGQTPAAAANTPSLGGSKPGVSTSLPVPLGEDTGLPPGVPPGSVPVNAGINPDAWAYQTPDGRIIRGSRGNNRLEKAPTAPGDGTVDPSTLGGSLANDTRSYGLPGSGPTLGDMVQPMSGKMPVTGQPQLVRVQAPDGEIREMPEDAANALIARGARKVA